MPDWNTYVIVAVIELARNLPKWLEDDYFSAIQELAKIGAAEVLTAKDPEAFRAILGTIAIAKGCRSWSSSIWPRWLPPKVGGPCKIHYNDPDGEFQVLINC